MTDEGSVFVDGVDGEESSDESTSENINNQVEDSSEEKKDSTETSSGDTTSENKDTTSENEEVTDDKEKDKATKADGEAEKTEKGTKLDSDPLSRANQLRANAEAEIRNYVALLNDPERLESYVAELKKEKGLTSDKKEDTDALDFDKLDPTKLETRQDIINFAKGLKEASQREIDAVKKQLQGFSTAAQQESVIKRVNSGISEVQTKYPELREFNPDGSKNPDYVPELDELVGATYNELDFDKRSGKYRGAVSIIAIADKIMNAKRVGEGKGSRKAQTEVIDKSRGRIPGTQADTSGSQPDDTKLSPSAAIAARMKRAVQLRRR